MPRHGNDHHDPSMRRSTYATTPLADVVRKIEPDFNPDDLRRELKNFLEVTNARYEAHHVRGCIDLRQDSPLFGGPVLNLHNGDEVAEFQAAWRAFRECSPVTTNDTEKIAAIWPVDREEPYIGKDELPVLRRVREQAAIPGYITTTERTVLDRVFGQIAERELQKRRDEFKQLGLVWRDRDGREEPAKAESKFTKATFPTLSSHYFDALLEGLRNSNRPAEERRTLQRIYEECRRLSALREEGKGEEAARGWRRFLYEELHPRYGGGKTNS